MGFKVKDGVLFSEDETVLIQYPGGKTNALYIMPQNVTAIAPKAFYGCSNLCHIVLSPKLERIEDETFAHSSLEDIYIPKNIMQIGERAFYQCESLRHVVIADLDNIIIGKDAFCACSRLEDISTGYLSYNSYVNFSDDDGDLEIEDTEGSWLNEGFTNESINSYATHYFVSGKKTLIGDGYTCYYRREDGARLIEGEASSIVDENGNGVIVSWSVKDIESIKSYHDVLYLGTEEQWEKSTADIDEMPDSDVHFYS